MGFFFVAFGLYDCGVSLFLFINTKSYYRNATLRFYEMCKIPEFSDQFLFISLLFCMWCLLSFANFSNISRKQRIGQVVSFCILYRPTRLDNFETNSIQSTRTNNKPITHGDSSHLFLFHRMCTVEHTPYIFAYSSHVRNNACTYNVDTQCFRIIKR